MKMPIRIALTILTIIGMLALVTQIGELLPDNAFGQIISIPFSMFIGLLGGSILSQLSKPVPFAGWVSKCRRMVGIHPPKKAGPLYAVRGWYSGYSDNNLKGIHKSWPGQQMEARCFMLHRAPDWDCRCGINCYKDARSWNDGDYHDLPIWGIVELSGRVIEHERGYRAEKAKVVAVCPRIPDYPIQLEFDVPIFTSFEHMCQEYGLLT